MSKERARQRAVREAEAAARAADREQSQERAARRRARRARWSALASRFRLLVPGRRPGQQTGTLAARRRLRFNLIVTVLALVQGAVWFLGEDWRASLAAFVVSALAFPVIAAFAL